MNMKSLEQMTDEEFLNNPPSTVEDVELDNTNEPEETNTNQTTEQSVPQTEEEPDIQNESEDSDTGSGTQGIEEPERAESGTETGAEESSGSESTEGNGKENTEVFKQTPSVSDSGSDVHNKGIDNRESIDYQKEYEKIVGTIKANGKDIDIRNSEEAIQLMQMGANYTQKMQQIAPYRKMMASLDKAGIKSQEDINYLIDLYNKNPQAIQKLIKDAEIDPLDIDTDGEIEYHQTNYSVSEQELKLKDTIDAVATAPKGNEVINLVHQTWDDQSKNLVGEDPKVLQVIHGHYVNGIYQQIVDEVHRLTVLGSIPEGTPFLQSYRAVGEMLNDQGLLGNNQQDQVQHVQHQNQPVATHRGSPKNKVDNTNNTRAKSASPVPSSNKKATDSSANFLNLSDEEFMEHHKKFMGRV